MKGDDVSWSIIPMIGKCTLFDPRKYFQMYKIHQDLIFAFKLLADISIRMFLIDGERASSRIIKSNFKSYVGSEIRIDVNEAITKKFLVTFEQRILKSRVTFHVN